MKMIRLIKKEGVSIPEYQTSLASGADVVANSIIKVYKGDKEVSPEVLTKIKEGFEERGYIKIRAFERILFGTGLIVADMPRELEIQVRARSGTSLKQGLMLVNGIGSVDSDYRGEMGVPLVNCSPFITTINKGDRVAQIVPAKSEKTEFIEGFEIVETNRGAGGFGSTGK
jgi:dUTP pyrophosphatase